MQSINYLSRRGIEYDEVEAEMKRIHMERHGTEQEVVTPRLAMLWCEERNYSCLF